MQNEQAVWQLAAHVVSKHMIFPEHGIIIGHSFKAGSMAAGRLLFRHLGFLARFEA